MQQKSSQRTTHLSLKLLLFPAAAACAMFSRNDLCTRSRNATSMASHSDQIWAHMLTSLCVLGSSRGPLHYFLFGRGQPQASQHGRPGIFWCRLKPLQKSYFNQTGSHRGCADRQTQLMNDNVNCHCLLAFIDVMETLAELIKSRGNSAGSHGSFQKSRGCCCLLGPIQIISHKMQR